MFRVPFSMFDVSPYLRWMPEPWSVLGELVGVAELEQVARNLVKSAGKARIWFFYGEMGSGKTTLIKMIGKVMGVSGR